MFGEVGKEERNLWSWQQAQKISRSMFRCPCTLADLWTKKSGTCLLLGIIKKWDAFLNSSKLNEVVLSLLKAQVVALPTLRSDLPSQDSQPLTEREVYSICFLYTCKCIHTYIYKGILLSKKKKEWNFAIFNNMDGHKVYHAKWNKSEKTNTYDFTLCGTKK